MIQRDGAAISLWQSTPEIYKPMNQPANINFDAIIVGGGITGITLALQLQSKGLQCVVLEANTICFGTTGGTTAHLNTLLDTPYTDVIKNFGEDKAAQLAAAAKDAIDLVKQNIAVYNIDCGFEDASAFLFSQDDSQTKELEDIYDACNRVHLNAAYSNVIPVPIPFEKAIEVRGQGKFNPVQYVYALAQAYEKKGGIIVQNCRVLSHSERRDEIASTGIIEVETSTDQTFFGRSLVYATHIPTGVNLLHFRCAPYRSYAMAVKLSDGGYPADLAYDMYDPYHYYRTQKVNDELFLIAGGEDHKTAHEENTSKAFLALETHLKKYFNIADIPYRWSSQYYEPTDGLPYIGKLPGAEPGVYVATGFGGNGITYSHVASISLTDLIINGKSRYENLFDPSRVKPVAGFKNFVMENADVVKQLVSKLMPADELESLSALAKGEAKVIEFENEKVALYKDNSGNLHAVNPACTHVKCQVAWNAVEQSWDCPCHGARYDADGKVLSAPAHLNLKHIELTNKQVNEAYNK